MKITTLNLKEANRPFSGANSAIHLTQWNTTLNGNDIRLKTNEMDISLVDLAKRVNNAEQERTKEKAAQDLKSKQAENEKIMGTVAVALTGAGVITNKNPVISRRFWSLGRGK